MPTVKELIRSGRRDELWQMCCGFLDLNLEQFMTIQNRLMLEQIERLNQSAIGKKIFNGTMPQDIEEFRKRAPLTTYKDYCPELSEKNDAAMPVKPVLWQHTSGRSTEFPFKWESIKWVPVTAEITRELAAIGTACAILSSCKRKGDTSAIKRGVKFIYAVAPRPYTSGTYAYIASQEIDCHSLPPLEEAEKMTIEDRIATSFKQALSQGLEFYFGVAVALVTIQEKLNQRIEKIDLRAALKEPLAFARVARGLLKSKIAGRRLLPKDLWTVKGIFSSGTDGTIFRDVIYNAWGRYPLNIYASTEASVIATQTWDYGSMTFIPNLNFLEFITEDEFEHWKADNSYIPKTVLLDGVKTGQKYEVVISNFHGAPLVRYRTGDVIRITGMCNTNLGIAIPQMEFDGRVDDIIDIGGFIRLNEKVIWQAVSNTRIPYVDWAACKEQPDGKDRLHIYIELKDSAAVDEKTMAQAIYIELKLMDNDFLYGNVENILNTMPIKVTLLPEGAFDRYINLRRAQGADLAHLKPHHINPSARELSVLMSAAPVERQTDRISVGAPAAS